MQEQQNVCVIGLGYVGLTLAVYLANKGMRVHGVDTSDVVLGSLSTGKAHFYEKDFDALLGQVLTSGAFTFGNTLQHPGVETAFIVTVGTPLDKTNSVNLASIQAVAEGVRDVLDDDDLVIMRSTVRVGVTRNVVKPILDQCGKSYALAFCPERTLEGCALEELATLPQIVSGADARSVAAAQQFFAPIATESVAMNSLEEAEMVKLLNNSERDLMFAFANEIAMMCDEKGVSASRVIDAANYKYKRSNLKKPGPVGGPCLEKDPYILAEAFEGGAYTPQLLKAGRFVNENMIGATLARVADRLDQGRADVQKIGVLGFAFKGSPPTGDMRGSLVYSVLAVLKARYPEAEILGHDWLAAPQEMSDAGVHPVTDFAAAFDDAALVVLQNNHPSYWEQDWAAVSGAMAAGGIIFDFWNQIDPQKLRNGVRYLSLGNMGTGHG